MTIDERRWQKKLARKRKAHVAHRPANPHGGVPLASQAAQRPIHAALVGTDLFEVGIGMAFLTREMPGGELAVAAFLVDVYCLGVKNAFFRVVSPQEWAFLVQQYSLKAIEPACLRKLVEGAVDYARSLDLAPHPDYAGAARLFGTLDAAECRVRYTYGKEGKPYYVSGPDDRPAQSRRIIATLSRRLGAEGFDSLRGLPIARAELSGPAPELRLSEYEITDEPLRDSAFERLPEEVKERIDALAVRVRALRPVEALAELRELIAQYPDIPMLHNFLYIACCQMDDHDEAVRVMEATVQRFPDYLFGRIAWADACLQRGEAAKIAEIFAAGFELGLLYPNRRRFHRSEVLGFQSIMARYFKAIGNRQQAERAYDLMCQIDPDDPRTRVTGEILHASGPMAWLREKLRRR